MQLVDISGMAPQMARASYMKLGALLSEARSTMVVGVVADRHASLHDGLHRKHRNPTAGHDGSLLHVSNNQTYS